MQFLCAFLLACLGSALVQAQDSYRPFCNGESFKGFAFDNIFFEPRFSYNDADNRMTYYKNTLNEGSQLWDYNTGTLYISDGMGGCQYISNLDFQTTNMTRDDLVEAFGPPDLEFSYNNGENFHGYSMPVGNVTVSLVQNDDCELTYIGFAINGVLRISYYYDSHDKLTDEDRANVASELENFQNAGCMPIDL